MSNVSPSSNYQMNISGSKLTITVELDAVAKTPSRSGKSMLIATTNGNQPIPGRPGSFIGLNIYTKN